MTENNIEQKIKKDKPRRKRVLKDEFRCVHIKDDGQRCNVPKVRPAKDNKCLFHSTDPLVQRLREEGWRRTAVATKYTAACPNITVENLDDAIEYVERLLSVFGHRKLSIHPTDVNLLLKVFGEYRQMIGLSMEQQALKSALKKTQPKETP